MTHKIFQKIRQRQPIRTSASARNALRTYIRDYLNIYENLEQSGDGDKMQQSDVLEAENGNKETSSNDDIIKIVQFSTA